MPRHATRTSFKKGNPGKPKGAKCKFTNLKDAFLNAFQRIGGEDALYKWLTPEKLEIKNKRGQVTKVLDFSAERHKDFFKMITPMLPKEVSLSGSLDVNVNTIKGIIDNASSGKSGSDGVQAKVPDGTGELEN
jgi:hypothetical protein